MKYGTHTKRTPEFISKVNRFREKLIMNTLSMSERGELADLLDKHTTDSACMVKAAHDEPIFVLRGKDPIGGFAVDAWIEDAERKHQHLEKLADARHCANEMHEYAKKVSDAVPTN